MINAKHKRFMGCCLSSGLSWASYCALMAVHKVIRLAYVSEEARAETGLHNGWCTELLCMSQLTWAQC